MNVGNRKIMKCARHVNAGRMGERLNDQPLEEVDGFKYLGSQVSTDGGCEMDVEHRMTEVSNEYRGTKSLLSNGGLRINTKSVCTWE